MKFLIIGCGSIGRRHLRNLHEIDGDGEFFVCDPDVDTIIKENDDLGYVKGYKNFDSLKEERFDGVLVCSPTSMHTGHAMGAIRNCKAIMIEKPISNIPDGVQQMIDECNRCDTIGMMAMCYRFNKIILEMDRVIKRNLIGRVYAAGVCIGQSLPTWHPEKNYASEYSARSDMGGGALLTTGSHVIDIIRLLFGEIVGWKFYVEKTSGLNINVDDLVVGVVKTNNNVFVSCQLDFLHVPKTSTIYVCGESGRIDCDLVGEKITIISGNGEETINIKGSLRNMYKEEARCFVNVISGAANVPCNLNDGLIVLNILNNIRNGSLCP